MLCKSNLRKMLNEAYKPLSSFSREDIKEMMDLCDFIKTELKSELLNR